VDVAPDAPALHEATDAHLICHSDDPGYSNSLVLLCARKQLRLLFPLIDTGLQKTHKTGQESCTGIKR